MQRPLDASNKKNECVHSSSYVRVLVIVSTRKYFNKYAHLNQQVHALNSS